MAERRFLFCSIDISVKRNDTYSRDETYDRDHDHKLNKRKPVVTHTLHFPKL